MSYVDRTLWVDASTLSASAGGSVVFDLIAGSAEAGQQYLVLGSISGTVPGFTKNGISVPLNWDIYTDLTLQLANTPVLTNTFGTLDGNGRAVASLNASAGALPPAAIGLTLYHAALAINPGTSTVTWGSNAVETIVEP